jgi:GT2 family glycosyltransferase
VEILVVDNASTDGSRELVRREFPGVRLVELATNEGPCVARNVGMERAATRLVLALDVDVILERDCLERLLLAFASEAGIAVASPRAIAEGDPPLVQYDGASFHYTGLLSLRNFYAPLASAEGRGIVPVDAFISVAILADRELLRSVGGYDPAFFFYFEDSDLSYRLRASGHRIVCVEEARVTHRGGTSGLSFRGGAYPKRRVFYHARNRCLFLVKNYQLSTLLRGLPGSLVYEGAAAALALAKGAPVSYVQGKLAFLGCLPGALRERRATSRRRRVGDRELVRGARLTLWPPLTAGRGARAAGRALDATLSFLWRILGGAA